MWRCLGCNERYFPRLPANGSAPSTNVVTSICSIAGEGYGPPAASDRETPEFQADGWIGGHIAGQATPEEIVRALESIGAPGKIIIYKGWFADTLPKLVPGTKFAVTVLSAGLFSSTDEVLTYLLQNRVVPEGAVLLFNDFNSGRASPRHCSRAAWSKAIADFDIEYSDEGRFHWNGRKFIVHGYR
jgi:hypothetical protein